MLRFSCLLVVLACSVATADDAKERPSAGAPARPKPSPSFDPNDPLSPPSGPRPPRTQPTPPPPAPPKPAPEIVAAGKQRVGSWKCKGNSMRPDGSSSPIVATVTVKLELDGTWIVTSLVEKTGTLKWTEYRTYDAVAKQWTKLQMVNTTGHVRSTSLGEQNGAWTWEGTAASPQGSVQLRDHEQYGTGQFTLRGEVLLGGSWQKAYEVSCTK